MDDSRYATDSVMDKMKRFCRPSHNICPREKINVSRDTRLNLDTLPFEIRRLIALHLLPVDLGCFALVSKSTFAACASLQLFGFSLHPNHKRNFLLRIEKDLPDHVVCFTCVMLYKWKITNNKNPRLCPYRDVRPHLSYGHLDIQHHNRRIERELVDLTIRHAKHGPKYGVPKSHILRILQGKERFNKSLCMPAVSFVGAYRSRETLSMNTDFEIRFDHTDLLHPFRPFVLFDEPEKWVKNPNHEPILHGPISAITRWLGSNIHESSSRLCPFRKDCENVRIYLCYDCRSSVQYLCRREAGPNSKHTMTLRTSQCFGTRHDAVGSTVDMLSLRKSDRELMPDRLMKVVECDQSQYRQTDPALPPFCTFSQTNKSQPAHEVTINGSLGVVAWFQRHRFLFSQRIWCERGADQWPYHQLSPRMPLDATRVYSLAFYSEAAWENCRDRGPYMVLPLRKYWSRHYLWEVPKRVAKQVGKKVTRLANTTVERSV